MIVHQVEFLPMLRSHRRKLPLRVNDNHTLWKELTNFFGETRAICSIFGSSHVGLLIQKIKESGCGFHVLANETYDQCSVKCQSQIKPKTKQCADDELKRASWKKLNAKSNPRFPQSSSSLSWFHTGRVVNNLCQKFPVRWFSCYAILVAQETRCYW